MSAVVETRQLIGRGQVFQLPHHAAQRFLVSLQGKAALTHALAQPVDIADEQAHPDQGHQQHASLQQCRLRVVQVPHLRIEIHHADEAEERQHGITNEDFWREEHGKHQHQHVQHQQRSTVIAEIEQKEGQPDQGNQHLWFGQTGVAKAQVVAAIEDPEKG